MDDKEVTEQLLDEQEKPTSKKRILFYLLIGLLIVIVLLGLFIFLNYQNEKPIVSIPFLDSYFATKSETTEITPFTKDGIKLNENENFSDMTGVNENEKVLSESGNTTGNFGNYGKAVAHGNSQFISTYEYDQSFLWKVDGDKFTKIYEITNERNGINDLQYYSQKLYLKSGGVFGYFDFNTSEFVHIPLKPGDSLPISPRIYNDKVYYITYDSITQFYIYEASLDGSNNKMLTKLDSGLRLQNFLAFTIKDNVGYLFINSNIGDYENKESKIITINLDNGDKTTIYTTSSYFDEYITYSDNSIYFLESDNQENENKSLYRLELGQTNPILVIDGSTMDITTINSNPTNLYYLDGNTVYQCDLDGTNQVKFGEINIDYNTYVSSETKPFLLLTNDKLFLELRLMDYDGDTRTMLYEGNLNNPTSFHEVVLPE